MVGEGGLKVVQELKITAAGTLPGEQALVALFQYLGMARETMSQANRDAWDTRGLEAYDRWIDFWKTVGLVK